MIALEKVLGPPPAEDSNALAVRVPDSEITCALESGAEARREREIIEVSRKLRLNFNHSIRIEK